MTKADLLLFTKLYVPQPRTGIVPRPRLIEQINNGSKSKLTLISAPAGYGKTTLASEWIQQTDIPVAWLSLDENDNDLARFLIYFVTALRQVEENIGGDVLAALDAPQLPQPEMLLTLLINDISTSGNQVSLVLDDCHLIINQEIYDALDYLITHQPPELHLVIIGRVDPLISLSRLRVGGQLTEIRSSDLRFTKKETTAFLNGLMNLDLSMEDIVSLDERTEGWVAGLQLAALSLLGHEDKHEFIEKFSGIHHFLIDYLVEEVLALQPSEIRNFLCRSSILDRLNSDLCDATLGISFSKRILQRLEDTNLFLIPLDDERNWYRYHHLFADFLSMCLHDEHCDQIPELHLRAADWFEQKGLVAEAISHFIAAEDYANAARVIESNAKGTLERSELAKLMKWVAALPEEYVHQRPRLWIYHTWALRLSGSKFNVVESQIGEITKALNEESTTHSQLKFGELYAQPKDEIRNLKAHLYGLRAFQGVYSENFPQVFKMVEKSKSYQPDEKFVWSSLNFALGWAYRFSGNLDSAFQAFVEASEISKESGNIYMAVSTFCRAAYGQVLMGKLHQAEQSFLEALEIASIEGSRQYPVAGYAYVYLSGIYHEWNDLKAARRYALEGIQLCKRVGYIMDQVVGLVYLSRIYLADGDLSTAQDVCQDAKELSQLMVDYVYVRRWVEDCQVRLWMAQGNYDALLTWVRTSDLRIEDVPDFKREIDHIILARALVALGIQYPARSYLDDALILTSNLYQLAETAKWNGKTIEILVLQALALHANGDIHEALDALETALLLAEPEGFIRTFVDQGQPMAELLQLVTPKEISPSYSRRLLRILESERQIQKKEKKDVLVSTLVEPLSKRELEVLKMLASDLSGPEIARELSVALSTVRYHTNNIYGKLSVHNRRQAVLRAHELDLL
jgi:LuxR family maltose regulon positive regulatory protein